jgi:hypothetical protein
MKQSDAEDFFDIERYALSAATISEQHCGHADAERVRRD